MTAEGEAVQYTVSLPSGKKFYSATFRADGLTTYVIDGVETDSSILEDDDVKSLVNLIADFYGEVRAGWPAGKEQ